MRGRVACRQRVSPDPILHLCQCRLLLPPTFDSHLSLLRNDLGQSVESIHPYGEQRCASRSHPTEIKGTLPIPRVKERVLL